MNMNDPIASLLGSWATELNLYSVLLRVAVSVVFAAMIGCERASKRHAAGQRTQTDLGIFAEHFFGKEQ